jgi:hypothetical protein
MQGPTVTRTTSEAEKKFSSGQSIRKNSQLQRPIMNGYLRISFEVVFSRRLLVELSTNLVLDQELDTLDGGSSSLGDSSGNTTHCEIS